MTEAAGERFAGLTALEAREAVVAALREEGRINRTEPYTHEVPYSQRSGERIEPLISLQWFMRMDELAAPAHAAVADGPRPHPPRGPAPALPRLAGEHPPVVHLAPAVVGPPAAGLVPRRRDLRGHGPARRARAGSATRTCWTRGSQRAVAVRHARLARRDGRAEGLLSRPTCCSTARDILFLWVARMVFMGLEFAGDIPFDDVYVHSIVQAPDGRRMSKSLGTGIDPLALIDGGPRPPVFTEGGDFPAYGADAVRYGLLAMSCTQDVRFNEEHDRARAASSRTSCSTRRGSCCCACPRASTVPARRRRRRRSRTRGSSRACRRPRPRSRDAIETFEFHRAAPRALRLRLRRAVRLVPRDAQAAPVRRGQRGRRRSSRCTCWPRRWTLAHPVIPFVTEEIWSLTCPARATC